MWNGTTYLNPVFTFTYNYDSSRLVITPNMALINAIFYFDTPTSAYQLLGFGYAEYTYNGSSPIVSTGIPDLSRLNEVFVYTDMLLNPNFIGDNGSSNDDNVMFSILIDSGAGSNIYWNNANKSFFQEVKGTLDHIRVSFFDSNQQVIGLMSPPSIVFAFEKYSYPSLEEENTIRRIRGITYR
jgi:hypothetical protein